MLRMSNASIEEIIIVKQPIIYRKNFDRKKQTDLIAITKDLTT